MPISTRAKAPRTRRDWSGVLTARLTSALEGGELVHHQATLIECPVSLTSFRRMHRTWVLGSLPVLAYGFEPETVNEFLHVNARIPVGDDPRLAARAAVGGMRDALELLRGLRGTLDYDPAA
jgi:hypothetical protein